MGFVQKTNTGEYVKAKIKPTVSVIPDIHNSVEEYGWGDIFGAAFRIENSAVSLSARTLEESGEFVQTQDYDPYGQNKEDISGFELYSERFIESQSTDETEAIKNSIRRELQDRQVLEATGWKGFVASMAAGVTDPIYAIVTGGANIWGSSLKTAGKTALKGSVASSFVRSGGKVAVAGGVSEAGAEIVKHASQSARSVEESFYNIGGGTVLAGLFGGTTGGLKQRKYNKLAKELEENLGIGGEAGPQIMRSLDDPMYFVRSEPKQPKMALNGTMPEGDLELVNAAGIQNWGVSPLARTSTSKAKSVKSITASMTETPLVTKGNVEGVATTPVGGSAETRIKKWDAGLASSLNLLDDSYTKYRGGFAKRVNPLRSQKMTYQEFRKQVSVALRNGDRHMIPEVEQAAKAFRRDVFDPLKNDSIKLGLLPEDIDVRTSATYLTRVYDINRIVAKRDEWDGIIKEWLRKDNVGKKAEKQLTENQIKEITDQITDHVTGSPAGRVGYAPVPLTRGPLKERVLNIPDNLIDDFLENDIDVVARQYIKTMAPDVELTRQFGRADMAEQIKEVNDEWNDIIKTAKNEKERIKFDEQKRADIRDIEAMRDRLRGTYKMPVDPNNWAVRTGRLVRDVNFLRMLGGMTLSAIPDIGRIISSNGFKPVAKGLASLAVSPKKFNMSRKEAKRAAIGLDMVLNSRASSLAEIADVYGRNTLAERGLRVAGDKFAKVSLMSQWNSSLKQFVGVVNADRFLTDTIKIADGTASKGSIRRLAQAGIGKDMAKRIANQFKEHGDDGLLKLSRTDKWTDTEAFDTFTSALLRDVDRTIVTPGVGEKPLWTSSETGKMVFQFKNFAAAAHHKVLLADLQHKDMQALNGFLISAALGSLTYGLKNYVAGREISNDPGKLVIESLDRSGAFGYMWDINNTVEKLTRGEIGVNRLVGQQQMSRYASRNLAGAFLGPSIGTLQDVGQITGALATGDFTQKDLHAVRKMLPGQNLFYMRTLLNELEKSAGRSLKLKQ